jgi:hypothetical protein
LREWNLHREHIVGGASAGLAPARVANIHQMTKNSDALKIYVKTEGVAQVPANSRKKTAESTVSIGSAR